jgi:hypothetical protein
MDFSAVVTLENSTTQLKAMTENHSVNRECYNTKLNSMYERQYHDVRHAD